MANVEQFEKAVTEAGAVAISIIRGPTGGERLVIQTPGGLITREVPLIGDLMHTTPEVFVASDCKRQTAFGDMHDDWVLPSSPQTLIAGQLALRIMGDDAIVPPQIGAKQHEICSARMAK